MKNLEKVVSKIEAELDEKDQVREVALKSARAVARMAGTILRGLHKGQDGKTSLVELKDEVSQAVMRPVGALDYDYTYVLMPMRI